MVWNVLRDSGNQDNRSLALWRERKGDRDLSFHTRNANNSAGKCMETLHAVDMKTCTISAVTALVGKLTLGSQSTLSRPP